VFPTVAALGDRGVQGTLGNRVVGGLKALYNQIQALAVATNPNLFIASALGQGPQPLELADAELEGAAFVEAGTAVLGVASVGRALAARGVSTILNRTPQGLQKFFTKHGNDFGLTGNWNPSRAADASRAIHQHINSPATRVINGTYRGNPVTHYLDPASGLNVIATPSGNFVSAWRLGAEQLESVLATGRLF